MNAQETIRLEGLAIGYRGRHGCKVVAEGLDASVRSGELSCLLGQNGVGKSTLLRTLAGFQPPLAGDIRLMGRPLKGYSVRELSLTLAVVLTERCDLTNMSVRELVGLGRSPYTGFWGKLGAEDRAIIDEAIARTGIEPLADRMVQTLSDGERQKAMLAKALAQQTPVIFLDEPTAFLDFPSKVEIMQLLHRLTRETGRTIFLSTHDLELALQIADCVWLMKRGEGVRTGAPEDLSIDGTMERFFPRRDVRFDPETGLFRIGYRPGDGVRLIGTEGIRRAMAAKALRRAGFDPEAREAALTVEVREQTFRLKRGTGEGDNEYADYPTLGELLRQIGR